jgi:6-phosphogluconate dehydrogenase
MEIAFVGLGRMGLNMVTRLLQHGHQVVATNRSYDKVEDVVKLGAVGAKTMAEAVQKLSSSPKVVWLMMPSGDVTEQYVVEACELLGEGDILIEGGNSMYKDSIRRSEYAAKKGISYLDAGTSGGVWGLKVGYALMVGGEVAAVKQVESIFKDLAPVDGYLHCGPSGAGHFVKMVHNGIEYGMMQAYGEGFEILKGSRYKELDMHAIAAMWNHGSVVRSWLLELAEAAFAEEGNDLAQIKGFVQDSGEGRWTVQEAIDQSVPAPVITLSLLARFSSRQDESFSAKVSAALRNQFGGHAVLNSEGKMTGQHF